LRRPENHRGNAGQDAPKLPNVQERRIRTATESEFSRAEIPVISPELAGPPPRRIELTGKGITLVIVTVVIIAIALTYACFVAAESARQFQIRTALRSAGNETTGQITELRNPFHALLEYVDYTFNADGKTYTGEAIVPLEDYHTIESASSLPIRYLPENPALNHPADWEWSPIQEIWGFTALVLIAVSSISFVPSQLSFERRLAAEGLATFGLVTKCRVSGRYGEFITLRYEFRTQDGNLVQGRGSFKTQQEVGAKVPILYLPQKPKMNAPYPLSTWRVAKR
jgi:hypothetical protein